MRSLVHISGPLVRDLIDLRDHREGRRLFSILRQVRQQRIASKVSPQAVLARQPIALDIQLLLIIPGVYRLGDLCGGKLHLQDLPAAALFHKAHSIAVVIRRGGGTVGNGDGSDTAPITGYRYPGILHRGNIVAVIFALVLTQLNGTRPNVEAGHKAARHLLVLPHLHAGLTVQFMVDDIGAFLRAPDPLPHSLYLHGNRDLLIKTEFIILRLHRRPFRILAQLVVSHAPVVQIVPRPHRHRRKPAPGNAGVGGDLLRLIILFTSKGQVTAVPVKLHGVFGGLPLGIEVKIAAGHAVPVVRVVQQRRARQVHGPALKAPGYRPPLVAVRADWLCAGYGRVGRAAACGRQLPAVRIVFGDGIFPVCLPLGSVRVSIGRDAGFQFNIIEIGQLRAVIELLRAQLLQALGGADAVNDLVGDTVIVKEQLTRLIHRTDNGVLKIAAAGRLPCGTMVRYVVDPSHMQPGAGSLSLDLVCRDHAHDAGQSVALFFPALFVLVNTESIIVPVVINLNLIDGHTLGIPYLFQIFKAVIANDIQHVPVPIRREKVANVADVLATLRGVILSVYNQLHKPVLPLQHLSGHVRNLVAVVITVKIIVCPL